MRLRLFEARGVRNLETLAIEPSARLNILTGSNGSGKTSVLEAISLLGSARSFRTAHLDRVINYDSLGLIVFGEVEDSMRSDSDRTSVRLGLMKDRGSPIQARMDGQTVRTASEFASVLPVQALAPDLSVLVTGDPGGRRRFLDWGVFHSESSFGEVSRQFRRNLAQRNAALRIGAMSSARTFDEGFSTTAGRMDDLRSAWIERFQGKFQEVASGFDLMIRVDLAYRRGWDAQVDLLEQLRAHQDSDLRGGFTRYGPHRADLVVRSDGRRASDVLSRGQLKVVAFCLLAAQSLMLREDRGRTPILVVDDLVSELDAQHRRQALAVLVQSEAQVFIADVAGESLAKELAVIEDPVELKWFHVEHGRIKIQSEPGEEPSDRA